jgi:hypothetical protein
MQGNSERTYAFSCPPATFYNRSRAPEPHRSPPTAGIALHLNAEAAAAVGSATPTSRRGGALLGTPSAANERMPPLTPKATTGQYPYRPPRVDPTFRDYQTEVPPMMKRDKAQNGACHRARASASASASAPRRRRLRAPRRRAAAPKAPCVG